MTIFEAIKTRRSIRKFKDKKVSQSLIKKLINTARLAPSAYNAQSSRFIIIDDKAGKQKLKDNNIFRQEFVYQAPLIIICCADTAVYPKERYEPVFSRASEIGGEVGAVRDLAIATQNLVLMATGLGLGSCYIGIINRDKLRKVFNIPKNYVLPFVIIAGYPDEKPGKLVRKNIEHYLFNK